MAITEYILSSNTPSSVDLSGTYNFVNSIMCVPSGTGVVAIDGTAQIRFITNSGVLVISNGNSWKTLGVAAAWGFSGLYPPQIGNSGALQEWLEPSGITAYATSGASIWERNSFGQLAGYSIKWTTASPDNYPMREIATLNGWNNVYFNGLSGTARYFDPGAAMNQGGNDQPGSWIYVLENNSANEALQCVFSFTNGASNSIGLYGYIAGVSAGHPSGTFRLVKRDGTLLIDVGVPAAVPYRTPVILSVVHSGTQTDVFSQGVRLATSGQNVASISLTVAGMGVLNRLTDAIWGSGLRVWEAMHFTSGLSAEDRINLENMLSSKYHIALAR